MLVDPEVTRLKLERELELWRTNEQAYRRRGWVLLGRSSGLLIFGTGLASVAFGVVQALAARRRVARAQAADGRCYLVAVRPGLGTPGLTYEVR